MSSVYSCQSLVDGRRKTWDEFGEVLGAEDRTGCTRTLGCRIEFWFVDSVTDRFGCLTDLDSHSSETQVTQHRQDKILDKKQGRLLIARLQSINSSTNLMLMKLSSRFIVLFILGVALTSPTFPVFSSFLFLTTHATEPSTSVTDAESAVPFNNQQTVSSIFLLCTYVSLIKSCTFSPQPQSPHFNLNLALHAYCYYQHV
jgi:hypothetical protein